MISKGEAWRTEPRDERGRWVKSVSNSIIRDVSTRIRNNHFGSDIGGIDDIPDEHRSDIITSALDRNVGNHSYEDDDDLVTEALNRTNEWIRNNGTESFSNERILLNGEHSGTAGDLPSTAAYNKRLKDFNNKAKITSTRMQQNTASMRLAGSIIEHLKDVFENSDRYPQDLKSFSKLPIDEQRLIISSTRDVENMGVPQDDWLKGPVDYLAIKLVDEWLKKRSAVMKTYNAVKFNPFHAPPGSPSAGSKPVKKSSIFELDLSKFYPKEIDDLEFDINIPIEKTDEDKRLAFGWASVAKRINGEVVTDHQGDEIHDLWAMEDAAYKFTSNSRVAGEMHVSKGVGELVESFVVTPEKLEKMGLPPDSLPTAWWVGFRVSDDRVWDMVKSGQYPMLSVHGKGKRKTIEEV